ncbi:MAG: multidrug effflux MFS transporter [Acetobacteraceae bacterium]|nr:multidrug effflux MFS transporter [Acetobacteraceae bacterium]
MPAVPASLIVILGALSAFGPLATDMHLPAFPAIAATLGTSPAALQGALAAFFAGMGLGQLLYGTLSDRVGRRPALLLGLVLFTAASVAAALAESLAGFVLARFVQGIGGCAGVVMSRAIARDLTEGPAMARLMSQLMLVSGIAPIIAPTLGGALLAGFGWQAIFVALALYGAALAAAALLLLRESLPPEHRRRDGPAAVLGTYGALLRDRRFLGPALSGALLSAGMFTYIGASPFVFMTLHGLKPTQYGLLFGLNALGIMGVAQLNALAMRRGMAPTRAFDLVQYAMAGAALLLLVVVATGFGGAVAVAVALFLYVACIGAVMPLASAQAMAAHGRVAGSASALIGMLQFGIGAAMGWMVGGLHDGTALPMALGITACALLSRGVRVALAR